MSERICHKCKVAIPDGQPSWYGLEGYECKPCSEEPRLKLCLDAQAIELLRTRGVVMLYGPGGPVEVRAAADFCPAPGPAREGGEA